MFAGKSLFALLVIIAVSCLPVAFSITCQSLGPLGCVDVGCGTFCQSGSGSCSQDTCTCICNGVDGKPAGPEQVNSLQEALHYLLRRE